MGVVDWIARHWAIIFRAANVVFVLGLLNMAFSWFLQGSVNPRSIVLMVLLGALLLAARLSGGPR